MYCVFSCVVDLLRVGLTSGQTVHALRKGEVQRTEKETNTAGSDGRLYTVYHHYNSGAGPYSIISGSILLRQ